MFPGTPILAFKFALTVERVAPDFNNLEHSDGGSSLIVGINYETLLALFSVNPE